MWRAMFLAIGIYLLVLGAQTLGVKEVTLTLRERPRIEAKDIGKQGQPELGPQRKLTLRPGRPGVLCRPEPWSASTRSLSRDEFTANPSSTVRSRNIFPENILPQNRVASRV